MRLLTMLALLAQAPTAIAGTSYAISSHGHAYLNDCSLWGDDEVGLGLELREYGLTGEISPMTWGGHQRIAMRWTQGGIPFEINSDTATGECGWTMVANTQGRMRATSGDLAIRKIEDTGTGLSGIGDWTYGLSIGFELHNTGDETITGLQILHTTNPGQDLYLGGGPETLNDRFGTYDWGFENWAVAVPQQSHTTFGYFACSPEDEVGFLPSSTGWTDAVLEDPDSALEDLDLAWRSRSLDLGPGEFAYVPLAFIMASDDVGGAARPGQVLWFDDGDPTTIDPTRADYYAQVRSSNAACVHLDDDLDGLVAINDGGSDCNDNDPNVTLGNEFWRDADGDGAGDPDVVRYACGSSLGGWVRSDIAVVDCDDSNGAVRPGFPETCNGIDDNCDGDIDEGLAVRPFWEDNDSDGYGDPDIPSIDSCQFTMAGFSTNDHDCDDDNVAIRPGVPEVVGDSTDENCDGLWGCWLDDDRDGFGNTDGIVENSLDDSCTDEGESMVATDCDDTNSLVNPQGTDLPSNGLDEDCDGDWVCWQDLDGDGYAPTPAARLTSTNPSCSGPGETFQEGDCDDTNPDIGPGSDDIPGDTIDQDCNGALACFFDGDGDSYGTSQVIDTDWTDCDIDGSSSNDDDCDDNNAAVNPGATDIAGNAIDEDCDGVFPCFLDGDGDGYGDTLVVSDTPSCSDPGQTTEDGDCDDSDPSINPASTEIPGDRFDEDCDGAVECWLDGDGDGYGGTTGVVSDDFDCAGPGEATASDDCDDDDASVRPNATEVAGNDIDEDCSGDWDCWADTDGDGFGATATVLSTDDDCTGPGEAAVDGDCGEGDASINPNAIDIVGNAVDEDCDGDHTCFIDQDGDGFGADDGTTIDRANCSVSGTAEVAGDCDDRDRFRFPDAVDVPGNDIDENCDGLYECYVDADGDGFAGAGASTIGSVDADCTDPGESATTDDCNDADGAVSPDATDVPGNDIDEDCDGSFTCFVDADGDGHGDQAGLVVQSADPSCTADGTSATADDCDDTNDTISPSATDVPGNDIDEDCDASWTCFVDADGDGFAADGALQQSSDDPDCDDPGEAETTGDCDDARADVNPDATDLVGNTIDEDCDGIWSCWTDADGDGFGQAIEVASADAFCTGSGESENADDCDDADALVNPDADDIGGNAIDEDCDGMWTCFTDADGDGFGVDAGTPVASDDADCDDPGESSVLGDCDDGDALVNPDAIEIPGNDLDENCDAGFVCWADADGDGFGAAGVTVTSADESCDGPGEADNEDDCDDGDALVNPSATEVAGNASDDDCDGVWWCFEDTDGDGFAADGAAEVASPDDTCDGPGEAATLGDCDDSDGTVSPAGEDVAGSEVDADCSGDVLCFLDEDGDGYGDVAGFLVSVEGDSCMTATTSAVATDCDDANADVRPGVLDIAGNDVDEDCDGSWACFYDGDGDGWGVDDVDPVQSPDATCTDVGEAPAAGDCDDDDLDVNPDTPDVPGDGVDRDCDGLWTCWLDEDGDGHGSALTVDSPDADCTSAGEAGSGDDCDDADASVNPTGQDVAGSGIDGDCDGLFTCFEDADGDGFGGLQTVLVEDADCLEAGATATAGDCDDVSADVNPAAEDVAGNELDEDCSGEWSCFYDGDADGHGDPNQVVVSVDEFCDGDGEAPLGDDCNDEFAGVSPSAEEVVGNDIDEDCDGLWDCYADEDGDGFGDGVVASEDPDCSGEGETDVGEDCDDANPGTNPAADEIADNDVDEDCDGIADGGIDTDFEQHSGGGSFSDDGKVSECGCDGSGGGGWTVLAVLALVGRRRRLRGGSTNATL